MELIRRAVSNLLWRFFLFSFFFFLFSFFFFFFFFLFFFFSFFAKKNWTKLKKLGTLLNSQIFVVKKAHHHKAIISSSVISTFILGAFQYLGKEGRDMFRQMETPESKEYLRLGKIRGDRKQDKKNQRQKYQMVHSFFEQKKIEKKIEKNF